MDKDGTSNASPVAVTVDAEPEIAQRLRELLLHAFIIGHSHGPSKDYQVQLKFRTLKESQRCHTLIEALAHPEYVASFVKQGALEPLSKHLGSAAVGEQDS